MCLSDVSEFRTATLRETCLFPFFFPKRCAQARASLMLWLLDDVWTAEALVRLLRLSFTCFEKCYRISNTHLKPSFQITPLNIMKKNIFTALYKIQLT